MTAAVGESAEPTIGPGLPRLQRIALAAADDPVAGYLGTLDSAGSRRVMTSHLRALAQLVLQPPPDGEPAVQGADVPWWELTYRDIVALRAHLVATCSPATGNARIGALRQVLHSCRRLGHLTRDDVELRLEGLRSITATRIPAGREVPVDDRAALLAACSRPPGSTGRERQRDPDTLHAKNARDGCAIALLYATAIRRAELVGLDLEHYDPGSRILRVLGKGNKEREVPVARDAVPWLEAWLRVRGRKPGPLLQRVTKSGAVVPLRISGQTVADLLDARARQAGLHQVRPHDLRRTAVGDLLEAGADLVTVQQLCGHEDPKTTARYDRRGRKARLAAVDLVHLPTPPDPIRAASRP